MSAVNVVNEDANWRNRIKSETLTTSRFMDEWGFLAQTGTPAHLKVPHATATFKYHSGAGIYTVKQVKVPLAGKAAQEAQEQATLFSHSQRLEHIEQQNPMYEPLSRTYGSRHTLEQFGVSQFGVKDALAAELASPV